MANPCAFCGKVKELRDSHIVPKAIFRWLKKSSATGFLRSNVNPLKREQDGLKIKLLCEDCEGEFNRWETPFANNFFHPYHSKSSNRFPYDEWMSRCLTSICWRALLYMRSKGMPQMERDFPNRIEQALSTWRAYLRHERPDVGEFEIHLIPLAEIAKQTELLTHDRIHRFLLRAVQISPIQTQQSAVVAVKMGHLLVIGFICEPERTAWDGTQISLGTGVIEPAKVIVPHWLFQWIDRQAAKVAQVDRAIPDHQRATIAAAIKKDPKRARESETSRALDADLRLALGRASKKKPKKKK